MILDFFSRSKQKELVSRRAGESKLGEHIICGESVVLEELKKQKAKFIVLGIPEDVGPRANCGRAGADTAWNAFLPKFLNVQESNFLSGKDIILLGNLSFEKLENYHSTKLEELRKLTSEIDQVVSSLLEVIFKADKIPIIIGGGHNNCYGILKGASKALHQKVNCLNLDPHADFRNLEGRHSGNGFSYAMAEGWLNNYAIVGLHENYNSQLMMDELKAKNVHYSTFEDIFLRKKVAFEGAIEEAVAFVHSKKFGVELDCDSIIDFPSSAQTPSGISANNARLYLHKSGKSANAIYLHLPEAAPTLVNNSDEQVGKLLSYFVTDFIKSKA